MVTSRGDMDAFHARRDPVLKQARKDLEILLRRVEGLSADQARDVLLKAFPALEEKYGYEVVRLAAQWYEELREQAVGGAFTGRTAPFNHEAATRSVKSAVRHVYKDQPDHEALKRELSAALNRHLVKRCNDTIALNVNREGKRTRPGWARVPRGAKTCAFCFMLASRDFTYKTADTAGLEGQYHDDCDCLIVPSWDENPAISGYHPDEYYQTYKASRDAVADADENFSTSDVLADLRMRNPGRFTDSVKPKKSGSKGKGEEHVHFLGNPVGIKERWERQKLLHSDLSDLWIDGESVEVLEEHEIYFLEKFEALGERAKWIPKDRLTRKPTNDFIWLTRSEMIVELKSVSGKYSSIKSRIQDAVIKAKRQEVDKQIFIIDLGNRELHSKLRRQLEEYNIRVKKGLIQRLYVMSEDGTVLEEIKLKK